MTSIREIAQKYSGQIDFLDLEIIIAHELKKTREFVLAHPEYQIPPIHRQKIEALAKRRLKHEPLAYILSHKEFFGLNFKVNRHTLIPRPETELLVEETLGLKPKDGTIVDVGTGSGNIIISLAKNLDAKNKFLAIDVSGETLKVAKQNAKQHKVDKKIKFLRGNLLEPILKPKNHKLKTKNLIVLANLPYLSKEIYNATDQTVKKYEPKSALYSPKEGLKHYEELLKQIKEHCFMFHVSCFMEISPEQKSKLEKLAKKYFPQAKVEILKDLANRWRVAKITF